MLRAKVFHAYRSGLFRRPKHEQLHPPLPPAGAAHAPRCIGTCCLSRSVCRPRTSADALEIEKRPETEQASGRRCRARRPSTRPVERAPVRGVPRRTRIDYVRSSLDATSTTRAQKPTDQVQIARNDAPPRDWPARTRVARGEHAARHGRDRRTLHAHAPVDFDKQATRAAVFPPLNRASGERTRRACDAAQRGFSERSSSSLESAAHAVRMANCLGFFCF